VIYTIASFAMLCNIIHAYLGIVYVFMHSMYVCMHVSVSALTGIAASTLQRYLKARFPTGLIPGTCSERLKLMKGIERKNRSRLAARAEL
jgi:hypothetical protein